MSSIFFPRPLKIVLFFAAIILIGAGCLKSNNKVQPPVSAPASSGETPAAVETSGAQPAARQPAQPQFDLDRCMSDCDRIWGSRPERINQYYGCKEQCYHELAERTLDPADCDKIFTVNPNPEDLKLGTEKTKINFGSLTGNRWTACIRKVAVERRDISICDAAKERRASLFSYEICVEDVAKEIRDGSLCNRLGNEYPAAQCYANTAKYLRQPALCDAIVVNGQMEKATKLRCYIDLADVTNDASLCDKITTELTSRVDYEQRVCRNKAGR